jgi:hypothetical protein
LKTFHGGNMNAVWALKVQGFVTEDGRLELQLPPDAPRGAVEVFITAEARPPAKVYPTGAEIAAELESGALEAAPAALYAEFEAFRPTFGAGAHQAY